MTLQVALFAHVSHTGLVLQVSATLMWSRCNFSHLRHSLVGLHCVQTRENLWNQAVVLQAVNIELNVKSSCCHCFMSYSLKQTGVKENSNTLDGDDCNIKCIISRFRHLMWIKKVNSKVHAQLQSFTFKPNPMQDSFSPMNNFRPEDILACWYPLRRKLKLWFANCKSWMREAPLCQGSFHDSTVSF